MKKTKKIIKQPMVLVLDGCNYFLINSDEDLLKYAVQILDLQIKSCMYGGPDDFKGIDQKYNKDDLKDCPDWIKDIAVAELNRRLVNQEHRKSEFEYYKKMRDIVKRKDGRAAWEVLEEEIRHDCSGYLELSPFSKRVSL
jgi:Arc/MetJ family transcription regulator